MQFSLEGFLKYYPTPSDSNCFGVTIKLHFVFTFFSCKIMIVKAVNEPCKYQDQSHALSSLVLTKPYEIGTIFIILTDRLESWAPKFLDKSHSL